MGKALEKPSDSLYERDFHAWLNDQAAKLRERSHNDIDWDNLAEEVESVGRSQKREIRDRLASLIRHLLKWQFQPGHRAESWRIAIGEQRTFLGGLIELSPSLSGFVSEAFPGEYRYGRQLALNDIGVREDVIPETPPFDLDQAMNDRYLPGEPFAPWDDHPRLRSSWHVQGRRRAEFAPHPGHLDARGARRAL
jgi:hypothetical protein